MTSGNRDEKKVPGLLEMLSQVPDTRKKRGRRYALVFVLAVAACCALAGAKTYREIGDQAADLPQDVLARLGGRMHPLKRAIIVPSEKRIRTLIQAIDAQALDKIIGAWLRALAQAGKLEPLLTAIAIDGKWLRGIADGTEKLFAAMLQEEKVIIGQHRIPVRHQRDHPGQRAAGRHRPGELPRDRRRCPRPARHRGIHRGEGRRRRPGRGLRPDCRACFTLLLLLVMACQRVQPGRIRPGYGALCGVLG